MHGSEKINHTIVFVIIIFHLLLYVAEIVKQSQTMRSGRFESNFLTLQANLTHKHGERRHPCDFSPFFPIRGSGSPPSTTESDHSTLACCAHPGPSPKVSESKVHSLVQSSTFKCLTKYTTHYDLIIFSLHRRDITSTTTPLVILICCSM